MAGHNKWSKIKHRKAVVDKRRGKVWTKIAKTIIVAAKNGGGDPDSNLALRYAIDEARYANMPRDTIERAVKKGAGGGDTSTYETIRYEGYGPGGVAIIVDALTDNRTRTITDVRTAFSKFGGNVGASGCVAYMFQHLGRISIDAKSVDEERLMEVALEGGASDVLPPDDPVEDQPATWTVITPAQAFQEAKSCLTAAGFSITDAQLAMVPDTTTALSADAAADLESLVEMLEDLDDVQAVFTNAE
ncbi:MAG: YebC/PmpR family DNA-binding transcriptional regulator [Phycisphaerales bacterium]